jgi:putative acetyltransferase
VFDEAPAIAEILRQSFAEYESLYTPEGLAATTPPSEQIQNRFNEGPVWVALQGAAIVGTVAAVLKDRGVYVRSMAILPTARGLGIGRVLLEHVERFASESGQRRLSLSTTPFLLRAIRLYEQFGFRRSDEGPQDLFGTPLFTMEKLIGQEH